MATPNDAFLTGLWLSARAVPEPAVLADSLGTFYRFFFPSTDACAGGVSAHGGGLGRVVADSRCCPLVGKDLHLLHAHVVANVTEQAAPGSARALSDNERREWRQAVALAVGPDGFKNPPAHCAAGPGAPSHDDGDLFIGDRPALSRFLDEGKPRPPHPHGPIHGLVHLSSFCAPPSQYLAAVSSPTAEACGFNGNVVDQRCSFQDHRIGPVQRVGIQVVQSLCVEPCG